MRSAGPIRRLLAGLPGLARLSGLSGLARRARPAAPVGPVSSAAVRPAAPGDFAGRAEIEYAPHLGDGLAAPGEVVWAWVPYEEDPRQGKDRPVLVIGRDGGWLLALLLTSRDRVPAVPGELTARGAVRGSHDPRRWHDVGVGAWDRRGRSSEVRLDRVLRLAPSAVRREGAVLDRARFEEVAAAAREVLGW